MLLLKWLRFIWRFGRAPTDVGAGHPLLGMSHPLQGMGHPLPGATRGLRGVRDILAERHGITVTAFNLYPGTSRSQVIEVAREAGSHAGLAESRSATPPAARSGADNA